MTSGAWLLLTFFFRLFHCKLVVTGIENFRAVILGQEVTVMVFQRTVPPQSRTLKSRVSLGLLHSRLQPK